MSITSDQLILRDSEDPKDNSLAAWAIRPAVFDSFVQYRGDHRRVPEGLYLGLYNGVAGDEWPGEEKDDWGFPGIWIGPLEYAHTTYASDIKCAFVNHADFAPFKAAFPNECRMERLLWLTIGSGEIILGGCLWGDWTVFHHKQGEN